MTFKQCDFVAMDIRDNAQSFMLLLFQPTGDLKLVEKPSPLTLAPHDFANIKANVKVASTENGIIFGNIGKRT
jgi:vesicle coat complex subunit